MPGLLDSCSCCILLRYAPRPRRRQLPHSLTHKLILIAWLLHLHLSDVGFARTESAVMTGKTVAHSFTPLRSAPPPPPPEIANQRLGGKHSSALHVLGTSAVKCRLRSWQHYWTQGRWLLRLDARRHRIRVPCSHAPPLSATTWPSILSLGTVSRQHPLVRTPTFAPLIDRDLLLDVYQNIYCREIRRLFYGACCCCRSRSRFGRYPRACGTAWVGMNVGGSVGMDGLYGRMRVPVRKEFATATVSGRIAVSSLCTNTCKAT
jgi:hypothetical protein